MEIWATMRQEQDGRWVARADEAPSRPDAAPFVASAPTREECVRALRQVVEAARRGNGRDDALTLVIEVAPLLAGVAEAAQVLGWDKRRVITYLDRGRFPAPLQSLASGRVWTRRAVEEFAADWQSRQAGRRRARAGGAPAS